MKAEDVANDTGRFPSFSAVVIPATPSSEEPANSAINGHLSPYTQQPSILRTSIDSTYSELSFLPEELSHSSHATASLGSHAWRGFFRRLWVRNKGVFHVLLSQVFGAGMNVATRILETSGTHGPGMVCFPSTLGT